MKFTVTQPAEAHQQFGAGPITEYLGRIVPLRIGELAYPAELLAVKPVGGEVELTFDLPDTDLRWEALTA